MNSYPDVNRNTTIFSCSCIDVFRDFFHKKTKLIYLNKWCGERAKKLKQYVTHPLCTQLKKQKSGKLDFIYIWVNKIGVLYGM